MFFWKAGNRISNREDSDCNPVPRAKEGQGKQKIEFAIWGFAHDFKMNIREVLRTQQKAHIDNLRIQTDLKIRTNL